MTTQLSATVLRLPDEREFSFAEYGDASGVPVFGFHGTPGSRHQLAPVGDMRIPDGIRIIAPDRPGYGHSSFQPGRRLLDWPGDVSEIADYLGLDGFGVFGLSGGGPHALACAHAFGERLLGAACVSGIGPLTAPGAEEGMMPTNRITTRIGRVSPALMSAVMRLQTLAMRHLGDRLFSSFVRQLPEPDREILSRPSIREAFTGDLQRMSATAGSAAGQDFQIFLRDWGFRLEEIRTPVHFWQGDLDRNVPPHHARIMAEAVPDATVHDCPGEGHLLIFNRLDEILEIASGRKR